MRRGEGGAECQIKTKKGHSDNNSTAPWDQLKQVLKDGKAQAVPRTQPDEPAILNGYKYRTPCGQGLRNSPRRAPDVPAPVHAPNKGKRQHRCSDTTMGMSRSSALLHQPEDACRAGQLRRVRGSGRWSSGVHRKWYRSSGRPRVSRSAASSSVGRQKWGCPLVEWGRIQDSSWCR